jgi:copper chaperone CopZ
VPGQTDATMTVLLIRGMKGNECRERIVATLEGVRGVREADVSLQRARAVVLHDAACNAGDLIEAVARAGYEAVLRERT